MGNALSNFLLLLFTLAILATLLGSNHTSGVINSLSSLLSNSIKAAKAA
jgi:hypothetical protein